MRFFIAFIIVAVIFMGVIGPIFVLRGSTSVVGKGEIPVRNIERNSLEMARILERISHDELIYPVLPDDVRQRINKVLRNYYGGN